MRRLGRQADPFRHPQPEVLATSHVGKKTSLFVMGEPIRVDATVSTRINCHFGLHVKYLQIQTRTETHNFALSIKYNK
jgi:hypothetical protein